MVTATNNFFSEWVDFPYINDRLKLFQSALWLLYAGKTIGFDVKCYMLHYEVDLRELENYMRAVIAIKYSFTVSNIVIIDRDSWICTGAFSFKVGERKSNA